MAIILVLEKTPATRREMSMALVREGHHVLEAGSMQDFITHAPYAEFAMIDIDLPGDEGDQAARYLRQMRPQAGVILLSERGDAHDRIRGLRQYADQYLVKPIAPELLSAHLAPMVRRFSAPSWRLDAMKRELHAPSGHREALNGQEMRLMELLAGKTSSSVSRRAIVTALGYNWLDYDERRLDQMVSRLRRRWFNNSGAELPLHTDRGVGYHMSVPLALMA